MSEIIKVIIVDDHKIFRAGLEMVLNDISDVKVVAYASDGKSLLPLLKRQEADILFMDIKLPGSSGIELTKMVKERYPHISVIALTMFSEIEYFNEMMDAGADGFLLKNTQEEELALAIKSVLEGQKYLSKEFVNTSHRQDIRRPKNLQISLSKREKEVLKLICKGMSNHEIAKELFISNHTVDGHRRNLIIKTGVKNAPNLVMFAIQNGLITP